MAEQEATGAVNQAEPYGAQGVTQQDLSSAQTDTQGNPAPDAEPNKAPVKEPTAEEVAAKKAEDDKKAAEEAAKKPEEEAAKTEDTTQDGQKDYFAYEDESAKAVVSMLKEAGVTATEADAFFKKAVDSGKLEDIDVAGLTAKVGKEKASLIMLGAKDYYNRNMAATKEIVDSAYAEVGGKENYEKVREYFRKRLASEPALKASLDEWQDMFDLNKKTALAAVREMVEMYNNDPKNRTLQIRMVQGDKAAAINLGEETLSKQDYLAKMKVAQDKRDFAEIARLRAVRVATRNRS